MRETWKIRPFRRKDRILIDLRLREPHTRVSQPLSRVTSKISSKSASKIVSSSPLYLELTLSGFCCSIVFTVSSTLVSRVQRFGLFTCVNTREIRVRQHPFSQKHAERRKKREQILMEKRVFFHTTGGKGKPHNEKKHRTTKSGSVANS